MSDLAQIDTPQDIAEIRAFFWSHGQVECRRLLAWFDQQFGEVPPVTVDNPIPHRPGLDGDGGPAAIPEESVMTMAAGT